MCGRYSITTPVEALAQAFRFPERPNLPPRYNLAPTQEAPIVRREDDGNHLALLRWGLVPFWAKDASGGAKMINARAETVMEKPAFRDAFRRRRCLVLADGFYEWKLEAGKKQPYRILRQDAAPMAFAGLWERWHSGKPDQLDTFSIITTTANATLRSLHDRMPVILEAADVEAWLAPAADTLSLKSLLKPLAEDRLRTYRVHARVGNVRNDDADCVAALSETGELFS